MTNAPQPTTLHLIPLAPLSLNSLTAGMILEEIQASHALLSTAFQKYIQVCSAVANYYESGDTFAAASHPMVDITSELTFIASCGTKVKQAKAIINRARNSCTAIVPIHTLPFEVMSHIFQLVVDAQPCHVGCLKLPESLSHVCYRWRQISLGSHRLWSHIDLVPFGWRPSSSKGVLARANAFAVRAGRLSLHLHIFSDPGYLGHMVPLNLNLPPPISTRIGRLELVVTDWLQNVYPNALEYCFTHCTPATLDQLILTDKCYFPKYGLIEGARGPANPTRLGQLNISHQRLEDLLLPLKVLRLTGFYFHWESKAYHGLVDLQLIQASWYSPTRISITQLQLARILAASPGLRKFRFGINITGPVAGGGLGPPTVLNELEQLSLHLVDPTQYQALLRMLPPGPKLLRVSIYFDQKEALKLLFSNEFAKFLSHSNIRQLYMRSVFQSALPQLLHLLRATSTITELSLASLRGAFEQPVSYPGDTSRVVATNTARPVSSRLDCLKFSDCHMAPSEFRLAVKAFPAQKLELEDCNISVPILGLRTPDKYKHGLAKLFPVVKISNRPRSLHRYWAPWD